MKELYISPELEVLCFAPVERLAKTVSMRDLTGYDEGEVPEVSGPFDDDFPFEIDVF